MTKTILKTLSLVFVLALVGCAIIALLNFTYFKRTFTGQSVEQVRDISWYEPKFEMAASGSADSLEFPDSNATELFAEAIDYAESINSSAFLKHFIASADLPCN